MSSDVLMPQLGETVSEGKILNWFKQEGDDVKEGDNLFEVETDKVTMEVQATADGKLGSIRVKAGEVAKVGAVVAVIGGVGKSSSSPLAPTPTTAMAVPDKKALAPNRSVPTPASPPLVPAKARSPFEEVSTPTQSYGPAKGAHGLRITPLARRLIAQHHLDADAIARTVSATGGTRIAERDVRAALGTAQPLSAGSGSRSGASAPAALQGGVLQLNAIRRRTGERLAQNWQTIPHVFQAIEVDYTNIEVVRAERREKFKAENGTSLTYLPFIARATCIALKEFPEVNAQYHGDSLTLATSVHLGIAVDLSHNGLVVPVVRNADELTLMGLARALGRLVAKARDGKLTSDDFAGGTYSISNNGAFGTSFTAPIINAPQVAILSTDAIRLRPAVVETPQGAFIAPRLMGMVGQSFDHRAFDGAYSAAYLSRIKAILEARNWAAEFA